MVPHHVGPYLVVDQLGHGGMGTVYLATDEDGNEVAVKVLSSLDADSGDYRRFQREGDLLLSLRHPNLVGAVGRGTDERTGMPYIALELVRGRDLDDTLVSRPQHRLTAPEAAYVIERCARGLEAAHAVGIIHRDLKPGNVLLTPEGEVRLTDFGIALTDDVSERLTANDEIVGTPHYVPPEVLTGENASWAPAADFYALGCLAYRMLSGTPVFDRPSLVGVLEAHVNDAPEPLESLVPGLPAYLCDLVHRLLSKEPSERPGAAEIQELLREHLPQTAYVAGLWADDVDTQRAVSARLRREVLLPENTNFHHFLIVKELGRGGMGVVYEAQHLGLRKRVALKVMLAGALATDEERRRFLQEAEAAASLRHPNLVEILDAGEYEGTYYLTMEFVEGQPLSVWMREHAGERQRLLRVFSQVCDGVEHAHSLGIVHRDLKPENVIVDEAGVPHVLDFGIAKRLDQERPSLALTNEGDLLGTVRYMAPEQAAGDPKAIGPRSDVYSLGAILYEMLTGSTPFTGKASEVLLQLHLAEPAPPSRKRKDLPWELDAICLKALEKSPDERYESPQALRSDVERFLAQRPITARQATRGYRARKWAHRNRRQIFMALASLLLVAGVLGAWGLQTLARERARTAKVLAEVRAGWEAFQAQQYSDAATRFDRAAQDMRWDDQLPLPPGLELPPGANLDSGEAFGRTHLNKWLLAAEERRKFEYVQELIGQVRQALDQDKLTEAGNLMLGLRAVLIQPEPQVEKLEQEVTGVFVERAKQALARTHELQQDDFLGRAEALDRARELFDMALSLSPDQGQALAGVQAVRTGRAALEGDRERALREKQWLAREINVSPAAGVVADGAQRARISVALRNPAGEPLAGLAIKLMASGAGNSIVQPTAPTDATGQVEGWIASSVAEIKTITVVVNPGSEQLVLTQRPTVEFVPGAPAPETSRLELPSPQVVADGDTLALLNVTARDAMGNPVPGQRVVLRLEGPHEEITLAQPRGVTDATGRATGAVSGTKAGSCRVRAVINPGPDEVALAQVAALELVAGPPSATSSRVVARPASGLVADGVQTAAIEVLVRDRQGNPIEGRNVRVEASGSGNTLAQPEPTDAEGKTQASLAASVAEIKTVTVIVSPGPEQVALSESPTVQFQPGPPDTEASSLTVAGADTVADGAAICTLTVTLADALGNPLAGQRVTLEVSGEGNHLEQPGPTGPDGVTRTTLTSTRAGAKTVTATVNPGPEQLLLPPAQVDFVAGPPDPEASRVEVTPNQLVADGTSLATVRVTVRDAQGNPVPGRQVELAVSGDGRLVQPSQVTDAAGEATGSVSSSAAGPQTVTAIVDPGASQTALPSQPTVTFRAGPLDPRASMVELKPNTAPADGATEVRLHALLQDAHGNPLAGMKVEVEVLEGAPCTITPAAGVSDAEGAVEARVSASAAGKRKLRVLVTTSDGARVALDAAAEVSFE